MNVNITLLTMMTLAARRRLPRGLLPGAGGSEVDMADVPMLEDGLHAREGAEGWPFQLALAHAPGPPTRLADGRGLESVPVRSTDLSPVAVNERPIGSPVPVPCGTRLGLLEANYR